MTTGYTERQLAERRYHDEKYGQDGAAEEYRHPDRATDRFWELVGRPSAQTILDFGCGDGWVSIMLAEQGNRVHGFDISESLVSRARRAAEAAGLADRITFREMAAEQLDYSEESFDLVVGMSILHHTDLDATLQRIRNVLKSDGRAIFMEPLNQNLALRIWRILTPWRRSETERAFTREDLATVKQHFPGTRFTYFYLVSMFAAGLLVLAPRSRVLGALSDLLERVDAGILAVLPALGRFSAVAVMEMRK